MILLLNTSYPQSVVILSTKYTGGDYQLSEFARNLPDMLTTELSQSTTLRIIERSQILKIIGEISFERSGYVDEQTAAKWGRLMGSDFVVLTNLVYFNGIARIDARVVRTESGRVITPAKVEGSFKDPFVLVNTLSSRLLTSFTGESKTFIQPRLFEWNQDFAITPSFDISSAISAFSGGNLLWENSDPYFVLTYTISGYYQNFATAVDISITGRRATTKLGTVDANISSPGSRIEQRINLVEGIYLFTITVNQMSTVPIAKPGNWTDALVPNRRLHKIFVTVSVRTLQ